MTESRSSENEVRELVGLRCWAAEFSNNEGIALQLGGEEPIAGSRTTMGTHIFSTYDAEWELRLPDAHTINSESDAKTVWAAMPALEAEVSDIALDTKAVEISLRFESGSELVVRPDPACGSAAEAWIVLLPGHRSISGFGDGVEPGDSRNAPGTREGA